jgi:DNA-binding GntR family transcriptional regulator
MRRKFILEDTRGENSRVNKLTEKTVREIRKLRAEGATYSALAKRFSVSETAVRHAAIGMTWSHVR